MPTPPSPARLAGEVLRLDRSQISYAIALRDAIGVVLPLAAGVAVGHTLAGLSVATGALNVGFSDSHDPYRARAARMLGASLLSGLSVFVGATAAGHDVAAVAASTVWALGGGMAVLLGPVAGQLGVTTLVLLIVFGAQPAGPVDAAALAALVAAGGVLQTALALGSWPARGLAPERHALATAWRALAAWARSQPDERALPATAETSAAAEVLTTARADHGPAAELLVNLFNQLERARLDLVALAEQRRRLAASGQPVAAALVGDVASAIAGAADAVSGLVDPGTPGDASGALAALARVDDAARAVAANPAVADAAAARTTQALAGQVRAAVDLARRASQGGAWEALGIEAALPAALRVEHVWPRVRANLTMRSAAFRHAVRLAACVALADMVARAAQLPHGYWIPMTVAIVLKPDFTATMARGIARVAGTLLGVVVTSALALLAPGPVGWVVLTAVLVFVMRSAGRANYALLAMCMTALIVVLFALAGAPPAATIHARAIATVIGGVLALGAYALWPTWERTQTPLVLADLLDAYREYFAAVVVPVVRSRAADPARLLRTRHAARLARANAEASVDRLRAEPSPARTDVDLATRVLASSRRFARSAMILEAELAVLASPPQVDGFDRFVHDVDATFRNLAGRLRGSAAAHARPNLRAEQLALRAAADADHAARSIVSESDRITNAVDTMAGLVDAIAARQTAGTVGR